MPRPRKLLFNGSVVFLTTSTEEGLIFPPNPVVEEILWSALARAQTLYPVIINDFCFESTHAHFMLTVKNPDDVKNFMERFKTESAHMINRLLGRKKRTVWCEGYDSPLILTPEDVVRKIIYIYLNPSKDGLADSIDSYPGINSWTMIESEQLSRSCRWINRPAVKKLDMGGMTLKQYKKIASKLRNKAKCKCNFTIDPTAWMHCFEITDPEEQAQLREKIVTSVRKREQELREERVRIGKTVIGAKRLRTQPIDTTYRPNRSGRRMFCICSDIELRKWFISMIKGLIREAYQIYKRWKLGDFSVPYPSGLYPPAMPKLVEPLGVTTVSW